MRRVLKMDRPFESNLINTELCALWSFTEWLIQKVKGYKAMEGNREESEETKNSDVRHYLSVTSRDPGKRDLR